MTITPVAPVAPGGSAPAPRASSLGRDDFLKLLTTQLRYQNPLDPVKDAEFLGQLSQFSTLEGIQKLNANFADLLMLQGLSQGANLIGKTVTFDRGGSAGTARGTVESVRVENGGVQLVIGGTAVPMAQVRGIDGPRA